MVLTTLNAPYGLFILGEPGDVLVLVIDIVLDHSRLVSFVPRFSNRLETVFACSIPYIQTLVLKRELGLVFLNLASTTRQHIYLSFL